MDQPSDHMEFVLLCAKVSPVQSRGMHRVDPGQREGNRDKRCGRGKNLEIKSLIMLRGLKREPQAYIKNDNYFS